MCVDYTGADGVADMTEVASRLATQASVPLMVDSTEAPVVEAALMWIGGRPILNSVNLEEGDDPGTRLDKFLTLAREYGAAVVCTCIDTEGQARTRRLEGARRHGHPRHRRRPLRPRALRPHLRPARPPAVDGHGGEPTRRHRDARGHPPHQGRAARGVHHRRACPTCRSGSTPRRATSSTRCSSTSSSRPGSTPAIVHAARIIPLSKIDERAREVCLDLIYDRRTDGYDPLQELLGIFEGVSATADRRPRTARDGPSSAASSNASSTVTATGSRTTWPRRWRAGHEALTIVNDFLLAGMKTVGELFATGEMQLPFVLQSAETMKAAVSYLEPHMEKADQGGKGTVVLATVKGDVHDIGKNLVDIILTNNGYEIVNLGIKVNINEMLQAAEDHKADAIGMSGLLVKSTLIMRENLEEMNTRNLAHIPVLLGGCRPDAQLRRARPARRSTKAASSTARTPSRGCAPWTASSR